ncbi:ABC transporter ATP-binding protein [Roseiconus lacunae]|uniref:ABC transporter ATP-binding protein n=1 Tax=Roseiconus lacunae TaxID=2605694 RepID=A0ABT7PBS1_9BACT|nr:ABC transporter ATP-binding protein [Roseiconus lacunae]MCD0462101.1 ABC transporter ATP-binding protein [Roseiconus lacunae]MDM4013942.1 ABC transporter ATP-binding protein [Roseiconus lacunae]WRQ53238.1 ABC transporter ATP-binding protein [Stieleria sp. HD01]
MNEQPVNELTASEAASGGTDALEVRSADQVPHVHSADTPSIELRRLHRFFGKTKAVNDITFEVQKGQVFGYIGPNGAGKTTSMRILATLDLPSYGDAFVDGFSVVNDPELVRKRLGFMPDSFGTYRDVNCREYLDFFARAYGLVGRERNERLKWVIGFTGTEKMSDKPIRGLSKGMKQRLCLGRALIHDPAVLILDEPAAGLDPRARIELRKMIRELADRGKTILISSHILTELAEMCDAVGIIEQGQLLATGHVDDIQKEMQTEAELTLRILNRQDDLTASLQRLQPHVDLGSIVVDGQLVRFGFSGDLSEQAAIVSGLVAEGFQVAEVSARKKSLEDVFLQVTEGLVQ